VDPNQLIVKKENKIFSSCEAAGEIKKQKQNKQTTKQKLT